MNQTSLQRNDFFLREIQHFFDCVSRGKQTKINLYEGKKSLDLALEIKSKLQKGNVNEYT